MRKKRGDGITKRITNLTQKRKMETRRNGERRKKSDDGDGEDSGNRERRRRGE